MRKVFCYKALGFSYVAYLQDSIWLFSAAVISADQSDSVRELTKSLLAASSLREARQRSAMSIWPRFIISMMTLVPRLFFRIGSAPRSNKSCTAVKLLQREPWNSREKSAWNGWDNYNL